MEYITQYSTVNQHTHSHTYTHPYERILHARFVRKAIVIVPHTNRHVLLETPPPNHPWLLATPHVASHEIQYHHCTTITHMWLKVFILRMAKFFDEMYVFSTHPFFPPNPLPFPTSLGCAQRARKQQ